MKALVMRSAMVVLCLATPLLAGDKPAPRTLDELIAPVLKARCEAVKNEKDIGAAEYDKKVAAEVQKVIADQTEAGDEGAVVLLDYWLGEGAGLTLSVDITERGKRLLPLLKKYAKEPPPVASPCKYAAQDEDVRQGIFKMLTDMVEHGEKLN